MSNDKPEESKLVRAGRVALEEIAAAKAAMAATGSVPLGSLAKAGPNSAAELAMEAHAPPVGAITATIDDAKGAIAEGAIAKGASAKLASAKLAGKVGGWIGIADDAMRGRNDERVAAGLLAAATARGQPLDVLLLELEAQRTDPATQAVLRETLRAMIDALDPVAVEPLGRLLAQYLGPPRRAPDRFLRDVARTLADCAGDDLQRLGVLLQRR